MADGKFTAPAMLRHTNSNTWLALGSYNTGFAITACEQRIVAQRSQAEMPMRNFGVFLVSDVASHSFNASDAFKTSGWMRITIDRKIAARTYSPGLHESEAGDSLQIADLMKPVGAQLVPDSFQRTSARLACNTEINDVAAEHLRGSQFQDGTRSVAAFISERK